MAFRAERISESRKIILNAPLNAVFRLFGPIEEARWAPGWEPNVLFLPEGAIQEHIVFTTKGHHDHEAEYTWTMIQRARS